MLRGGTQRRAVRKEGSTSRRLTVVDFCPSSAWTQIDNTHALFIDLDPGFQKDDLKIQLGEGKLMTVSGQRRSEDKMILQFKETYPIPDVYERMDWTLNKGQLYIHFHLEKAGMSPAEKYVSPIKKDSEDNAKDGKKDEARTDIRSTTGAKDEKLNDTASVENTEKSLNCTAFREEMRTEITEIKKAIANGFNKDGSTKGDQLEGNYIPEEGFVKCLLGRVRKNTDLVATAIMSFALGWYMSQKKNLPGN